MTPEQRVRPERFISVDVQVSGSEIKVVFEAQDATLAPYRIDNMSPVAAIVSQSACRALEFPRVVEEIQPGARLPFAWEQVAKRPPPSPHSPHSPHSPRQQGGVTQPRGGGYAHQHG